MKSVKERIDRWESKNSIAQTNPGYNIITSSVVVGSNPNASIPNRQSVVIDNRMTEMEQARKLLEAMQIKNNNSNLIPGMLPPRQSMRVSQQRAGSKEDNRTSMNRATRMKNPEDSMAGSYQKQFLNIRGTLNIDYRNQPPALRNTVDINYDGDILKPSKFRQMSLEKSKNLIPQQHNRVSINNNYLNPHGGYFRNMENSQHNTLKSEVIKIDKGLHYRTQKIINTLFGEEVYDQFGYGKGEGGALRMTGGIIEGNVPKFRSEGIPLKGIVRNKSQRQHENFDNL